MKLVERIHRGPAGPGLALALTVLLAACGGNIAAPEDDTVGPPTGPSRERGLDPRYGKLFGDDLTLGNLRDGRLFGSDERGEGLPVNRYLWQASLDTLDFLPLVSTDPFTGVIATDWAGPPDAPGERVKVTVYLTSPELEASSLRVAVFRQVQDAQGRWQAAPVSPQTALQLENAILTRARQIRIAEIESQTG